MVLGNLIQINAKGPEDIYLYGNPQITYFKEVYKRATNFSINYSKIPFTSGGQVNFGSDIRFSVPLKADLLGGIYLKIKLGDLMRSGDPFLVGGQVPSYGGNGYYPEFTSYVNGIGFNIIDTIKFYINGQLIQTLDSQLIYLLNELYNEQSKKQAFYRMTQFYPSIKVENRSFRIANYNVTGVNTELLIPFFFSNKTTQYLPICALTHSDIQVHIKLKTLDKCIVHKYNASAPANTYLGINGTQTDNSPNGPVPALYEAYNESVTGSILSFEAIAEYIYLDDEERKLFLNKELSYLIELYNIGSPEIINNPTSSNTYYMDINAKHPTKFLLWTLQREDVFNANFYDNYTNDFGLKYIDGNYNYHWVDHLMNDTTIMLNNSDLSEVDSIFLSEVQLYEKFNNSTNSIVYLYSFALNPRQLEPTGTINLSKILHKTLKIKLVDDSKYTNNNTKPNIIFRYYSCYYNILSIQNGLAGIVFQ